MLDTQGRAALTDFGIAKGLTTEAKTTTGILKGKVAYMAPEQLAFKPATQASDLFSLGVTLFELLTVRRLYGPVRIPETPERILHEEPPDLLDYRRDAPPELTQLCLELLAKRPDERPRSAAGVASRLEPFASGLADVGALVREVFGPELEARRERIATACHQLAANHRAETTRRRRRTAARWSLAVAAGVGLGAGAAVLRNQSSQPAATHAPATAPAENSVKATSLEPARSTEDASAATPAPKVLSAAAPPSDAGALETDGGVQQAAPRRAPHQRRRRIHTRRRPPPFERSETLPSWWRK